MYRERNIYSKLFGALVVILIIGTGWYWGLQQQNNHEGVQEHSTMDPVEKKKARTDYFFNLLRDPATNSIPKNIRSRELNHARQLPSREDGFLRKSGTTAAQQIGDITWHMAGPEDMGGRTRALAFDQRDASVILAGGVSGGMWKSTDGGNTWQLKTDPNQNMSVTSVAQDPTDPDTWYYATGEYRGNSASDRGSTASYYGSGIYRSTDNGESWAVIPGTEDTDVSFSSIFDFISRIKVSPKTGSVFAASNASGLLQSTDGTNFSIVKGDINEHAWVDFDIDRNGNILAVFSSEGFTSGGEPGIFYSTDDGDTWMDVTPADFPSSHERTYIAFAPSAPDTAYTFTYEGTGSGSDEDISFFMLDLGNDSSEDRSANLPDFGDPVGFVNTQFNYNMVLAVKPDDPDFVLLGATNLFRSRDGFATAPEDADSDGLSDDSEKDEYWIGGYANANNVSQYPNQHPDQHALVFHPDDPNTMWAGHDGGLSKTTDITAAPVKWEDTDQGYVTGQFYTVAIPSEADDDRIMGGTQDNGTPFYRFSNDNQQTTEQLDVSSGDGSYAFWGTNYAYVSSQEGNVLRLPIQSDGSLDSPFLTGQGSYVHPSGASNQLFIHPYAVDPNDEGIMYYPGETTMWRNTSVDGDNVSSSWESFEGLSETGYNISTLEVTVSRPQDRLYYGASSSNQAPKIFMLDNASASDSPAEISIDGAPSGAYVHDIAVNPNDGGELIAVMSNYEITGLYHSTDAGNSWTAIEGNLTGDSQNPGPSLRNATILPTQEGNLYLVGTSTGVYSTMTLNGSDTSWERESDDGSPSSIGYSVAEFVTSRPADGTIAVGTHGRGIFVGRTEIGEVPDNTLPVVEHTLDIDNNWQLIGSPMVSNSDVALGDNLQLFNFSGSYRSASSMESQNGYWVKSRTGSEIAYSGEADTTANIALEAGWNLIGGLADTVSTGNISDPDGILSTAPIYEYISGVYEETSDIKSLQGYWIHADQAGDIEISWDGSSSKNQPALATDNFARLTFNSEHSRQQFYVADRQLDRSERNRFLMPPQAPDPVLDVRTNEGLKVSEDKETGINLIAKRYPVTVALSSNGIEDIMLKGISGQDTTYYQFGDNGQVQIQHAHEKLLVQSDDGDSRITKHDLFPNYPNPFNPAAQIRYQVASQEHVTMEVYDVLGRKVQTLVDEQKSSGSYTVSFDGSSLSSGMYFVRLKAGEMVKLQKMTLIK